MSGDGDIVTGLPGKLGQAELTKYCFENFDFFAMHLWNALNAVRTENVKVQRLLSGHDANDASASFAGNCMGCVSSPCLPGYGNVGSVHEILQRSASGDVDWVCFFLESCVRHIPAATVQSFIACNQYFRVPIVRKLCAKVIMHCYLVKTNRHLPVHRKHITMVMMPLILMHASGRFL